jgi:hypothetical protein
VSQPPGRMVGTRTLARNGVMGGLAEPSRFPIASDNDGYRAALQGIGGLVWSCSPQHCGATMF